MRRTQSSFPYYYFLLAISVSITTVLDYANAYIIQPSSPSIILKTRYNYSNNNYIHQIKSTTAISSSAASSSSSQPIDENDSTPFGTVSKDDNEWKQIVASTFATDKRPVVLFDGVCNLCNGGVNFALDRDPDAKLRFASLQSKVGQSLLLRAGKKPNDISSIVFVTEEKAYFKSDAVLRIASNLDGALLRAVGTVGTFTPGFVKNYVYDFVAKNRYRFGEADGCRLDFDGEFDNRFVSDPS